MIFSYLENSAKEYPDKIAVEDRKEQISYKKLYDASLSLGSYIDLNIDKNNKFIGILMDKSIDFIVAIFGILSTKRAYVPLDESLPTERLEYIVEDAKIDCIVTDKKHFNLAAKLCEKPILVDRNNIVISEDFTHVKASQDSIAYILYTSGSTGKPKGIMHTQNSAISFISWAKQYFGVKFSDVLSSHAPFHFDLSIFDVFVSISSGAKLCLLPKSISCFPVSLIKYIIDKKITIWYSVPYIIVDMFADREITSTELKNLRTIIYAGESMAIEKAKKIQEKLNKVSLYNLYGPTETNVITYYKLSSETWERKDKQIPIGYNCPYSKIKIINDEGNECKVGEVGELCVKTDSLMLGYLGIDKNILIDGYYYTGDNAHIDENGLIIFNSRKDYMTKVNGFRVELGDIENNIRGYEKVRDCYAKIDRSKKRDKIVVVIEAENSLSTSSLEKYLRECLPNYMIPDEYIICEKLERNSRGKIVRK